MMARMQDDQGRGLEAGLASTPAERLAAWLLSLYLALTPVYWLPGVSQSLLRSFEWLTIVLALSLVFGRELAARSRPFPYGLLGPIGFGVFVVLWIPGLSRAATASHAVNFMFDVMSYCALLWCFYCIARHGTIVWVIFARAFAVFAVLAGLALINELLDLWQGSAHWVSPLYGGFALRSSAWSVGLALFLPLAALPLPSPSSRRSVLWRYFRFGGAVAIAGNQLLSSGRAGLAASLVVVLVLGLSHSGRRFAAGIAAVVLAVGALVCLNQSCAESLRIRHLLEIPGSVVEADSDDAVVSVCRVDQASTNRLTGWVRGVDELADSPLLGHGLRQVLLENQDSVRIEIHNLWLKWSAYTGLLAPLWFALMCASMLLLARRASRDDSRPASERRGAAILALIVLAGLVMSLFLPSVPLGKNVGAIWWAAAGTIAGISDRFRSDRRLSSSGAESA